MSDGHLTAKPTHANSCHLTVHGYTTYLFKIKQAASVTVLSDMHTNVFKPIRIRSENLISRHNLLSLANAVHA